MKFRCLMSMCLLLTAFAHTAVAETLAEIKLIAPLDESRGYCLDLFAHLAGALPIGGLQTHNCFSYPDGGMASGPNKDGAALDQGFDADMFIKEGRARVVYFDICMTLHEPKAGSFVATEPCNGELAQNFDLKPTGEIVPRMATDLCLTAGATAVPGGGGEPVHLIRKLSFETCDSSIADRQRWELRYAYKEGVPTIARPY